MVLYPPTLKYNRLLISPSMLKRELVTWQRQKRDENIAKDARLRLGEWLSNAD